MSEQPPQPPGPPTGPPAAGEEGEPSVDSTEKKPWWKRWWGITLIVLAALFVLMGIAGDGNDVADDAAEGPDTDESATETEEAEPEPEPEPEPEDQFAFEPVTLDGSGDSVIDVPEIEDVPLVATFEHTGQSNFAVVSYGPGGQRIDLMVNTIGGYVGTVPYNFQASPAELEITADGAWTVTISSIIDQPVLAASASGAGDEVLLLESEGRLQASHDGESNFAVRAWGERRDLLINDIGPYEGTVRLPSALALEITADGNWTFTVE